MKQIARLLVASIFVLPSLAFATTAVVNAQSPVVNAVLGESTSSDSGSSSNSSTTTTTSQPTTEKPDDKGLLDRLAAQKASLKLKLTTAETARLKLKCKVAQTGPVTNLSTRVMTINTGRSKVYNDVITRLNSLVTKLKAKNIDTSKLESEIASLKTKVTTFQTDLTTYNQAVVDLKSLDCQTDPTAFQTALQTARTDHDKVAQDATDIRSYVNDTIKATLKDIRAQLAASNSSTTNSTNTTTTGGSQ